MHDATTLTIVLKLDTFWQALGTKDEPAGDPRLEKKGKRERKIMGVCMGEKRMAKAAGLKFSKLATPGRPRAFCNMGSDVGLLYQSAKRAVLAAFSKAAVADEGGVRRTGASVAETRLPLSEATLFAGG